MLAIQLVSLVALALAGQTHARAALSDRSIGLSPFTPHLLKRQSIPDAAVPDACKSTCQTLVTATNACTPLSITEQASCYCESSYLDAYAQCVPCVAKETPSILGGQSVEGLVASLKDSCATLASLSADTAFASATALLSESASATDLSAGPTSSGAVASASAKVSGVVASASAVVGSISARASSSTRAATTGATTSNTGAAGRRVAAGGLGWVVAGVVGLVGGAMVLV